MGSVYLYNAFNVFVAMFIQIAFKGFSMSASRIFSNAASRSHAQTTADVHVAQLTNSFRKSLIEGVRLAEYCPVVEPVARPHQSRGLTRRDALGRLGSRHLVPSEVSGIANSRSPRKGTRRPRKQSRLAVNVACFDEDAFTGAIECGIDHSPFQPGGDGDDAGEAARVVADGVALPHVGDAVVEQDEDLGAMVGAEAVAGA